MDLSPFHYELLDDGWNCPPDDGFNFASSLNSSINDVTVIKDIPRTFVSDDKKRFSFGSSEFINDSVQWSRKSLSQPIGESHAQNPSLKDVGFLASQTDLQYKTLDFSNKGVDAAVVKKRKRLQQLSVQDEFFGVYCLISRSPNKYFKNRCYIGYTVDPNRRIRQHNAGKQFGGANKTDHRGPWDMVCIIHGFPNSISALRFEWAWQNPEKSRRLRKLELKKKTKESAFAFRIRIACYMLNSDPWKRLALTFRWLLPAEKISFPSEIPPPTHMVIRDGLVEKTPTVVSTNDDDYEDVKPCCICLQSITSLQELFRCGAVGQCNSHFHTRCLAKKMLEFSNELNDHLFPVVGSCPSCKIVLRWGDLVRDQRTVLAITSARRQQRSDDGNSLLIPKISYKRMQ